MTDLAPIHAMLAEKEERLRVLDAQREAVEHDAELIRDMLRAMGDPSIPPKQEKKPPRTVAAAPKKKADSRPGTRLGDNWRAAFAKLAEKEGEFTYDDVVEAANIARKLARTKINEFKSRGYVGTRKAGSFVLTDQGRQIATEYVESMKAKEQPAAPSEAATPTPAAQTSAAAVVPAQAAAAQAVPPRPPNQAIGAPGVAAPSAPVVGPAAAQAAAPISGNPQPSPAPGA